MTTAETGGPNGLAPAWLLHRRAFRNTSLIVDLFLPNQGRVGAVMNNWECYSLKNTFMFHDCIIYFQWGNFLSPFIDNFLDTAC